MGWRSRRIQYFLLGQFQEEDILASSFSFGKMKTTTTKTSGMLLPRKTIMKTQGAMTSSVPPLLDRPIGGLSSSIPERPISCGPYHLFMRDFRKSEDCKSAIKKAAAEKWASLSEGEKYAYELKMWERTSRFGQYIDAFRKLKQKQDDDEDEAKRSIPEVDAAKED